MLVYLLALGVILVGIFAVAFKDNIIKKLLGLSVMANGIHILLITIGYRTSGIVPIMEDFDFEGFAATAVDPLVQALVLTSIVINLSILAVGLSITILLYREYGTLNSSKIRRLWG